MSVVCHIKRKKQLKNCKTDVFYEKSDNFAKAFIPIVVKIVTEKRMTARSDTQKKQKLTYKGATARLEEIIRKIENNTYDMDVLADYIKEATQLIDFCKTQLYKTETELDKMLSDGQ